MGEVRISHGQFGWGWHCQTCDDGEMWSSEGVATAAGRAHEESDLHRAWVAGRVCEARTVFWPEDEACDAVCVLLRGHQPPEVHRALILGEWNEREMATSHPASDEEGTDG